MDSKSFTEDEINYYMKAAFLQCEAAIANTEVPVGCVFVYIPTKKIICQSHNLTNRTLNAVTHCEINCIRKWTGVFESKDEKEMFMKKQGIEEGESYADLNSFMKECAWFVSCEPCIMCAYALSLVNINEVYYGCVNDKFGGNGSLVSIHKGPGAMYHSYGGYLKDEAIEYWRSFYLKGNAKAPDRKRQRKIHND